MKKLNKHKLQFHISSIIKTYIGDTNSPKAKILPANKQPYKYKYFKLKLKKKNI